MQMCWPQRLYVCDLLYMLKSQSKLLPLSVCTGLAECAASSCVWRSFWGSEVPPAHLRTLQVWLWQPSSDLPTQGSQRRALEDPEVPHWRTRIWSKPYRPGIHSVHVHFYTFGCQQCVSCKFYFGEVQWCRHVTSLRTQCIITATCYRGNWSGVPDTLLHTLS